MMFEKVVEIICDQLGCEEEEVVMEANVKDDLEADSLAMADLLYAFEEEFDVKIPDEQVETIKTVGDIVKLIEDQAE